jgi:SAM-dependent methyltransferase
MSDISDTFTESYYDNLYFADMKGKKYRKNDGSDCYWGYQNPTGEWLGADHVARAWKETFKLQKCNTDTGLCKILDVGCGRGRFVSALRDIGVEAWGFDFSKWAIDNPYPRCQKEWTVCHNAITRWPYGDSSFDLTLVLDLMEHIYSDNLDFVIDEMYRVSKKWVFLQIATAPGGGSGSSIHEKGYIISRGEKIPIELEVYTVAGHVTVQNRQFWIDKLMKDSNGNERKWRIRYDMVLDFISNVPADVIANWTRNTILIMERT